MQPALPTWAALFALYGLMGVGGWLAIHARCSMPLVLLWTAAFPAGYAAAWQLCRGCFGAGVELKSAAPFLFYLNFFVSDLLQLFNPLTLMFIGAQWAAVVLRRVASPDTAPVCLHPPFRGRWLVANGGTTRSTSHSWMMTAQRYAYDFVVGPSFLGTAQRRNGQLEDYPAFGQPIFSPVDGRVVSVRRTCRDSPAPGSGWLDWWSRDPRGNHVLIECQPGLFVLVAHLRCDTVGVERGQFVEAGALLGQCGNSGRSTEPHLHLHCQRGPGLAFGVGLPLVFSNTTTTKLSRPDGCRPERGMQIECPGS